MIEHTADSFQPSWWLRNAHVQTIGSSLFARTPKIVPGERQEIVTSEGVRLEAFLHRAPPASTDTAAEKRQVILLHGWLGSADSSYILAAANDLLAAGHNVVRLNLRDHGNTAHLNEEIFHSARIQEVVDACQTLAEQPTALIGFSLGGNFALRVCSHISLPALAICPAIDPAASSVAIDAGPAVYRRYFLRKWYRSLAAKARAFPGLYDFSYAQNKTTVLELTELFIGNHLPYPTSNEYFDAYRITPEAIHGKPARIIASRDDPVCPWQSVAELNEAAEVVLTQHGGHCGYIPREWMTAQMLDFLASEH